MPCDEIMHKVSYQISAGLIYDVLLYSRSTSNVRLMFLEPSTYGNTYSPAEMQDENDP